MLPKHERRRTGQITRSAAPPPEKPHLLPPPLAPRHAQMLTGTGPGESAIAPHIVEGRGYWTATRRAQLAGVKSYQRRVPALVVPMYSPDGKTTGLQLRPDHPRIRDGKAVKYETPGDSTSILDVHPRMRDVILDPTTELWVTEGIKKADALTSRGLCTVGLIGVHNFAVQGSQGKKLIPCWDHVALDGRRVYVVYDADVMVKAEVQLALERLVVALEARGAHVLVVYLPEATDG